PNFCKSNSTCCKVPRLLPYLFDPEDGFVKLLLLFGVDRAGSFIDTGLDRSSGEGCLIAFDNVQNGKCLFGSLHLIDMLVEVDQSFLVRRPLPMGFFDILYLV